MTDIPSIVFPSAEEGAPLDAATIAELRQLGGENDVTFFAELVRTFFEVADEYLVRMQLSLDGEDWEALRQAAHGLKGSAGTVGAQLLQEICQMLEEVAAATDRSTATDGLLAVDREVARVRQQLAEELQRSS